MCIVTPIPLFLLAIDTYSNTMSTVLVKSKFAANYLHKEHGHVPKLVLAINYIFNTVQILRALL